MARAIALLAVLGSVLALAAPASAAAPNYILVSGRGLAHPVLLSDWQQNLKLVLAVAGAPHTRATLRGRPHLDLAEFWGWRSSPPPASPRQTASHDTFYPAHGSKPAVIVMVVDGTDAPRIAPKLLLEVFAAHGIPTRR